MNSVESTLRGTGAYVRSPAYDGFWLVLSPLWAIVAGWVLAGWLFQETISVFDTSASGAYFFYMALTQGHLLVTVFRTHANAGLLQKFYWRFTLVPVAIFTLAYSSPWAFATLFVLMVFWDVYHSSLQVFGLGRIYDRKAGNDPNKGRRADYLLCVMMYAGPVLGGVLLISHLNAFHEFSNLESISLFGVLLEPDTLASIPEKTTPYLATIQQWVLATALVIGLVYIAILRKQIRQGYRLPLPKLMLFVSTTIACIFAWGFNSFAMGYLIANLFHAVQYYALVWILEGPSVRRVLPGPPPLRLAVYLIVPTFLGLLSVALDSHLARVLIMVCALMHFWWDGFIWSVRTGDGTAVLAKNL